MIWIYFISHVYSLANVHLICVIIWLASFSKLADPIEKLYFLEFEESIRKYLVMYISRLYREFCEILVPLVL